ECQVCQKIAFRQRTPECFGNCRWTAKEQWRDPIRVRPDRLPNCYNDHDSCAAQNGPFISPVETLARANCFFSVNLRLRERGLGLHIAATMPKRSDSSSMSFQTESSSSRKRGSRLRLRLRGRSNGTLNTSFTRPGRALITTTRSAR